MPLDEVEVLDQGVPRAAVGVVGVELVRRTLAQDLEQRGHATVVERGGGGRGRGVGRGGAGGEGGLQAEEVVAREELYEFAELEGVALRGGVVAEAALAGLGGEDGEVVRAEGVEGFEDAGTAEEEFV